MTESHKKLRIQEGRAGKRGRPLLDPEGVRGSRGQILHENPPPIATIRNGIADLQAQLAAAQTPAAAEKLLGAISYVKAKLRGKQRELGLPVDPE